MTSFPLVCVRKLAASVHRTCAHTVTEWHDATHNIAILAPDLIPSSLVFSAYNRVLCTTLYEERSVNVDIKFKGYERQERAIQYVS